MVIAWAVPAAPVSRASVEQTHEPGGPGVTLTIPEDQVAGVPALVLQSPGIAAPTSTSSVLTPHDRAALHAACDAWTTWHEEARATVERATAEAAGDQGNGGEPLAGSHTASTRDREGLPRLPLWLVLGAATALGLGAGPGLERIKAAGRRAGSPAAKTAVVEM